MISFHIVLVEPEIPGKYRQYFPIVRAQQAVTCIWSDHLAFFDCDKDLKRAGLDYWHLLTISYYDGFAELHHKYPEGRFFCHTTKAEKFHSEVEFQPGDFLVFGKETAGLPDQILSQFPDQCIRLPMIAGARSLNLSNAVAVSVYEALRQTGYLGLC